MLVDRAHLILSLSDRDGIYPGRWSLSLLRLPVI